MPSICSTPLETDLRHRTQPENTIVLGDAVRFTAGGKHQFILMKTGPISLPGPTSVEVFWGVQKPRDLVSVWYKSIGVGHGPGFGSDWTCRLYK